MEKEEREREDVVELGGIIIFLYLWNPNRKLNFFAPIWYSFLYIRSMVARLEGTCRQAAGILRAYVIRIERGCDDV